MKLLALVGLLVFSAHYSFCSDLVDFQETETKLLDAKTASEKLTEDDVFIKSLSEFDLSSRLKTSRPVSLREYKKFISTQTLDWTPDEKSKIDEILVQIKERAKGYTLLFPKKLLFIKTTGAEEGGAAYCRNLDIVVLPVKYADKPPEKLVDIILHELFHLYSRNNLLIQERLYKEIGFYKTDELELPESLECLKITNPDAVQNNYYFSATVNGTEYTVMPLLLAKTKYDEAKGGEFFKYLVFYMLAVNIDGKGNSIAVSDNNYQMFQIAQIANYFDCIGENTRYIIHPEEILADNFVLLINQEKNVKSPNILKRMKMILDNGDN